MKIDGLLTGARALRYWELRQQVVANNLANAETPGFKGERVFARLMSDALPQAQAATDLRAGTLTQTEAPLDVALQGEGFFVVSTPNGERLTRGGSLRLDERERLVDANGNTLLGEHGPMVLPRGRIEIGRDGTVLVDGQEVDRLRIETVPAGSRLRHEGGTLFVSDGGSTPVDVASRHVRQGYLEESNVDTLGSMVEMIDIQRAYATVQNSLRVSDGVLDTIANQIGRVS